MKGKVYKLLVRPALMYALKTVVQTRRQEAELSLQRFSLGVTRIQKKYIKGTAQVERPQTRRSKALNKVCNKPYFFCQLLSNVHW